MLYLGERSKRDSSTVDLVNSDVDVARLFIKFLREIYRVDNNRIRIQLYCHEDPSEKIKYWSNVPKVDQSQFTKPYINTSKDVTRSGKMKYGMVHIRYSDKKLWMQIMHDIVNVKRELLG